MQVFFHTLGCKSNQYETKQLEEKFLKLGFTLADTAVADIFVVNTCSVTHIAERKARNIIRKLLKQNPHAKLYVCGCYANITDITKIIPEAIPIKQEIKLEPEKWGLGPPVLDFARTSADNRLSRRAEPRRQGYRVREFLKIQEGCDCFCSYCIIPYARPRLASEPPEKILAETKKLIQSGVKEIILTGINLGRYTYESKTLADILRLLLQTDIPRLRLSSLEPDLITPEILELMASQPRIARHLHIPLQSGSDSILKTMHRKYTAREFSRLITSIRKTFGDNIGLTTDIIVGFPGETAETFQETYKFIKEINFTDLHIFPYSPRPLTSAAGLAQTCTDKVQKQFIAKLEKLRQDLKKDFLQKQTLRLRSAPEPTILAENTNGGFSPEYVQIEFTEKVKSGEFYKVKPLKIKDEIILAKTTH